MKKILALTLAAAFAGAPLAAYANDAMPTGGFNSGSGNPQNNFTINTSDNLELALSAQARFSTTPAVTDNNNGTYAALPGTNKSGGGVVGALWDFDFSVEALNGSTFPSSLDVTITITDANNDFSGVISPLAIGDNFKGAGNEAQNSENLDFPSIFTSTTGSFNPNEANTYFITLTATPVGGSQFSDSIAVNVVPLPSAAAMGLGMLAVVGAAGLLRKKLHIA